MNATVSNELYETIKSDFQNGKSLRQLEKDYQINRKRISSMLKADNVHTDKSYSDKIISQATGLFLSGRSVRSIAKELKLDKDILANRLEEVGVRPKQKAKCANQAFVSTTATKEIARQYEQERLSVQSLADMYGRSTNYIWNILKHEGVIDSERTSRIYFFNEGIMNKIDTPEKAYWLGFLYADGYVCYTDNKYSVEVTLKSSDKKHLEKLAKFVGTDAPVTEKEVELDGKQIKVYRLTMHSKKLAMDLARYGCTQAKSLTLTFPTFLTDELESHFIRGYFDGDGCLTIANQKQYNHKMLVFGAVGTKEFLDEYEARFHKIGVRKCKYEPTGQAWQSRHGGNRQARVAFDYLYKDATVYLERKYSKFIAVLGGDSQDD